MQQFQNHIKVHHPKDSVGDILETAICHKCRLCSRMVRDSHLDQHFNVDHLGCGGVIGYYEKMLGEEWTDMAKKWASSPPQQASVVSGQKMFRCGVKDSQINAKACPQNVLFKTDRDYKEHFKKKHLKQPNYDGWIPPPEVVPMLQCRVDIHNCRICQQDVKHSLWAIANHLSAAHRPITLGQYYQV